MLLLPPNHLSTKGTPHHEEHWKAPTGMTSTEAHAYVRKTFRVPGNEPVGFSYNPSEGVVRVFRQHETDYSFSIGLPKDHPHRAQKGF